jgi:hypothetical protein
LGSREDSLFLFLFIIIKIRKEGAPKGGRILLIYLNLIKRETRDSIQKQRGCKARAEGVDATKRSTILI